MIGTIARKEFVDLSRDGRFRGAAAIVVGLGLAAVLVGWRSGREVRAERARAEAEARHQFEAQDEKNPHAAAHYGLTVFKPKPPLAFVDSGVDPYTGVAVHLEAHRRNEVRYRPAGDATALQRFGELTAAAVLQGLVPLLVILLAFPAIAAEREGGTLRQVLSLGVRPGTLVAGKAAGLVGALGLILVPLAGLGAGLVLASPDGAGPDGACRAAALGAGYAAYLAIFVLAGLTASVRARTARGALVSLLAFWIANAMLAPRLATDLARWAVPTPSSAAFAAAIQADIRGGPTGHNADDARLDRLKQDLLKRYQVATVEELPINFQGVALQAGEDHGNAVFDRHFGALWAAFGRQDAIRHTLGFAFPSLAIRDLSMALAGTDNDHARRFADAAEAHRRDLVRDLNRDLAEHGADLGFMYQAGPELWRSMPRFAFRPPGLAATLRAQAAPILALGLWVIGLAAALVRSTRRMGVAG